MATLRSIVTDALRENGLIQVGTTPESDEFDEALRKLITIINGLYGSKAGVLLEPISYGKNGIVNSYAKYIDRQPFIDSSYVPVNKRLLVNLDSAKTLYLEPNPRDGARFSVIDVSKNFATHNLTISGNGRSIEDASSVTLSTNGDNKYWFYRQDLGNWVLVNSLTADSDSPFPEEFDDLLITSLSMRLNPRYLAQTAPETAQAYSDGLKRFRSRYHQPMEQPSEEGLYRLHSHQGSDYVDSEYEFNLGKFV